MKAHKQKGSQEKTGNAAKLREIVELLALVILPKQEEYPAEYGGGKVPDEGWVKWLRQMQEKAKLALAAPPRNCDVGTAEEQAARMRAFCAKNGLCRDGAYRCENCGFLHEFRCELKWAQMPYVDGGADYQEKGETDGSR